MNFSSCALACTNTTSASPRRPVSSACPVPCEITFTSMPVLALNSGRMWPNKPESCVEVVDATTIDLSCATAGGAPTTAARAKATSSVRRVAMIFSSDQKLPVDEAARLLRLWSREKRFGRAALDHAAAVQQHDLAGETPRLAEIVGRHDDLDAARGDGANDILDR